MRRGSARLLQFRRVDLLAVELARLFVRVSNYRNSGSILVIHDMGNGFALKCPAGTQNMLRRIEVSNHSYHLK